jgi:FKBP-type peptidyl-prolyl cis-trans isomerase (trigger factor)
MKRPNEHEYASHVSYTRALEEYCNSLEKRLKVGLTLDELIDLEQKHVSHGSLTRAIEQKLMEKNT